MPRAKKFEVLLQGRYSPDEVVVTYTAQTMRNTPRLRTLINRVWEEQRRRAEKVGVVLFPGELCRLVRYWEEGGVLHLILGRTDYRELMGTNFSYPVIRDILGEEYLSNALGICAVVRTGDERMVIGQRGEILAEEAGYYHIYGGYLHPTRHTHRGQPGPFQAVLWGLEEEFGIDSEAVDRIVCLGLAIDLRTFKPGLIFWVDLALTFGELLTRLSTAPREAEHTEIFGVRDGKQSLRSFLLANRRKMSSLGQASLWMYGVERGYWEDKPRKWVLEGILRGG